MSYSRVSQNEFKPRVLRRYINNSNLTFKSDLMKDVMSPHKHGKSSHQISNNTAQQPQQLEMALKSFQQRAQPKNNSEVMVESALLYGNKVGDYVQSYDRILARDQPRSKEWIKLERSISQVVLKQYIGNDEGIFVKQSKPYNIISNFPQEILPLREFDRRHQSKIGLIRPPTD